MPRIKNSTRQKINKNIFFYAAVVLILFFGAVYFTLASGLSAKFAPGAALNPNCSPGETNCTVSTLAKSGATSSIASFNSLSSISIGTPLHSESLNLSGGIRQSGAVNPTLVSSYYNNLNSPQSISVNGQYMYVGNAGSYALLVYDISDPANPVLVGSYINYDHLNYPSGVYATGTYVYAISFISKELTIIDVSNPAHPFLISSTVISSASGDSPKFVLVKGKFAYIDTNTGASTGYISIFDISNPGVPLMVSRLTPNTPGWSPFDMTISGNLLYATSYSPAQLTIIDISSSTNPVVKGTYADTVGVHAGTASIRGNYAYFGNYYGASGLSIVDISSSTNPIRLGLITDNSFHGPTNILVDGDYLYMSCYYSSELKVFNISSTTNPVFVGGVPDQGKMGAAIYWDTMAKIGHYLYLSGAFGNIIIYDLSNPAAPLLHGIIRGEDAITGTSFVAIRGKYAYVASWGGNCLIIFDISNPANTKYVGFLSNNNETHATGFLRYPYSLAIVGNYAYLTRYGGFSVLDISNPSTPTLVGEFDDSNFNSLNSLTELVISGHYAFTANLSGKVLIIDIANPKKPALVTNYSLGLSGTSLLYLSISGKYLYATVHNNNTLYIIDISNPLNPVLTEKLTDAVNFSGLRSVKVRGRYAYLLSMVGKYITVVDVSNPANPVVLSRFSDSVNLLSPYKMEISGNYLYITPAPNSTYNNLTIFDISNPVAPKFAGVVTDSLYLNGVYQFAINGDYAYLPSAKAGSLSVVNLHGSVLGNISSGNSVFDNLQITNNSDFSGNWTANNSVNLSYPLHVCHGISLGSSTLAVNYGGYVGISTSTANNILTVNKQSGKSALQIGGKYPACLKLKATSDWTYCTALNGVLSCGNSSICDQ